LVLAREGAQVTICARGIEASQQTARKIRVERRARDLEGSVEEAECEAVHHIPIGRLVTPEDIADLTLFLVSERTNGTGQVIAVDGGAGHGIVY
jgi:NAD(P)-dependent dehydrogenase (short-subunit alcohol dehydrogenase family)